MHILVCRKCNSGLVLFLRLLDECIVRTQPYPDHDSNTACVTRNKLGIPCNTYLVDAEFDILLHNALYEETDEDNGNDSLSEIICGNIVKSFRKRYIQKCVI
jgi:hypothetical protein